MKAGYGKTIITPPLGVELCGYGYYLERKAVSILDELYVRAFALENEGERFILLNCDLLGFSLPMLDIIKVELKKRYNVENNSAMIISVHTHSAPAAREYVGCGEVDAEYTAKLPELILSAADKAFLELDEVTFLKTCDSAIEPISHNRDMEGRPEDHNVRGILIGRKNKKPIAVASYNCHPVTLGRKNEISADYPGQAAAALDRYGYEGIFITGICGDINPLLNKTAWGTGTFETIKQYGTAIAGGFNNNLKDTANKRDFKADIIKIDVPLMKYNIERIKTHADSICSSSDYDAFKKVVRCWEEYMTEKFAAEKSTTEKGTVHVLIIGDFAIAGINYETFTKIGIDIRAALPDKTIIIAGNTDDVRGYFPTKEAIKTGGYSAADSIYLYRKLPVAENAAEYFAKEAAEKLAELWEK